MDGMLTQFDAVMIRTTRNVTWLSGPKGSKIGPKGIWRVVCVVGDNEVMINKGPCSCRIPINDVKKVDDFDKSKEFVNVKRKRKNEGKS